MDRTATKITHMTEGEPAHVILTFAVPLLIGNVFQQAYNFVDTMIAGHFLGDGAIAAIGATGVLYSLLMNLAWGLNTGYCVVLSRLFGGGDKAQFRRGAAVMIELNLGIGALMTLVSVLFLKPAMRLLLTPADVLDQSYLYIVIILGGMLTTIAYNGCAGFLRAMGNSRTPLHFLILSSLLNLALDALFVILLHTGILRGLAGARPGLPGRSGDGAGDLVPVRAVPRRFLCDNRASKTAGREKCLRGRLPLSQARKRNWKAHRLARRVSAVSACRRALDML